MHKFRHHAKVAAWYDDPSDASGLPITNPFAKWKPSATRSNTLRRIETGHATALRVTQTDNPNHYVPSPSMSQSDHGEAPSMGLRRSATAPTATASTPDWLEDRAATPRSSSPVSYDPGIKLDKEAGPQSPETRIPQQHGILAFLEREREREENKYESNGDDSGKDRPKPTAWSQVRATVFNSWINVLFLLVPAGFALNYANANAAAVFAINFVAIIPSTIMVSLAIEVISLRLGELQGALLSITFNNATQLISSILLLKHRQIIILKTSLLGSIISNLLLMTGLCFFFGGVLRAEQNFNVAAAQTVSMMLLLAIVSLVVPTASRLMVSSATDHDIVIQSRGTSVIILVSYGLYLLFQLRTHTRMFDEPSPKNPRIKMKEIIRNIVPDKMIAKQASIEEEIEVADEDPEVPSLSLGFAIATLVISTALIAFNAEFATGSVQKMVHQAGISQTFVGFVIFPILSNDPESIVLAAKDKLYLSIPLTLDKCMQVALLIVPLLVILAWAMAIEEMTLDFDGFPVALSFASVIVVAYVVQEGKSNWLMGALLVKIYVIVVLATYFIR